MRVRRWIVVAAALGGVPAGVAWAGAGKGPESAFEKDPWPVVKDGPVKVFILAGQSNMQGHAALRTLEYLAYHPDTAKDYQHWKDRWGRWRRRNDVWVWTTDGRRAGSLTPGFGENELKIGPELGFGWVVGEHFDEQVLLIKTCWGGRSVRRGFLPPGAERPSDEQLARDLESARKKRPNTTLDDVRESYGRAYREMIGHVRDVLGGLDANVPEYDPQRGHELAGFVFFQGWNDMVDGEQRAEGYASYTKRLGQLIRDVRKDLKAPKLPVVIGELGVGGQRGAFQAAQAAVGKLPDLASTVRVVPTAQFWEPAVEEMVKKGVWKGPDWVRFYNIGSERGYHYLGSARILYRIGEAMGRGMTELIERRTAR